ncbi:hypothetical protein GGR16_004488 [Chelatococcus caeni]|uniref:Uncharacterized protein n=1 Tax=Chelatococcus caeni TaxID=1348468 RepID=A0A840CAY5_9HYPH|nr:hypothetical protein [Chelatococcus caeni]MBB4019437.1 hypothetical protein [Chelatococcus caeni]
MLSTSLFGAPASASTTIAHQPPFPLKKPGANLFSPAYDPHDPKAAARIAKEIRQANKFMHEMFPEMRSDPDVAGDAAPRRERAADGAPSHRGHHRKKYHVSRKADDAPGSLPSRDAGLGDPIFRIDANGKPRQVGWRAPDGTVTKTGPELDGPKGAGHNDSAGAVQPQGKPDGRPVSRTAADGRISQAGWRDLRQAEAIKRQLDHPEPRQFIGPKDSIFLVHPNVAKAFGGQIGDPSIQSKIIDAIQKKGIESVANDFGTFAPNVPMSWDFKFDFNGRAPTGVKEFARADMRLFRDELAWYIHRNNENASKRPLVIDSATTYILVSDVEHGVIGQAIPGAAYMIISFNHLDDGVLKHEFGHKFDLMHDDEHDGDGAGVMYPSVRRHQNTNYTDKNKDDMVGPLTRAIGYDPKTGNALPGK